MTVRIKICPGYTLGEKRRKDAKKAAKDLVEFLRYVKPAETLQPGLKLARKLVRYFT